MKTITDSQKIEEILTRCVETIYPSKESLEKVLKKGKKLVIYHGVDPTAPHLHLGHSTNYLLLKKFQELGHQVILLIGDFTARIGDPTGKSTARKSLTKEEVMENCKNYQKQIGKILNFKSKTNPALLKFNSQWLGKFNLEDIVNLTAKFTNQRMIERDMFQKRIKEKKPIWLNEFLYPLLQGYDSVAMDVDVEIGGNDQTFNMLVGRELMKDYKKKDKFVISTALLINPKTGKKLMSKSEGNFIALDDPFNEMYGKTMALPDELVIPCFKLCTEVPIKEIDRIEEELKLKKINPRDAKAGLAGEIVTLYYDRKAALRAKEEFNRVFKDKNNPSSVPELVIKEKKTNILDLLVKAGFVPSKSEAKRLILQGGVKINNEIQKDWQKIIEIRKGDILKAGKRKFIKIK
jgi:tyrosyl-tRNA synthetase